MSVHSKTFSNLAHSTGLVRHHQPVAGKALCSWLSLLLITQHYSWCWLGRTISVKNKAVASIPHHSTIGLLQISFQTSTLSFLVHRCTHTGPVIYLLRWFCQVLLTLLSIFKSKQTKTPFPSLKKDRMKNNRMNKSLYPNKGLEMWHFYFQKIKCCDLLEISYSEVITKLLIFFSTSDDRIKNSSCKTWQIELIVQWKRRLWRESSLDLIIQSRINNMSLAAETKQQMVINKQSFIIIHQ